MYQMNRTNLNRNEVYHGRTSQGLLWLGWSKVRVLWTLYKRAFSRLHNTLTVFCTENLLEFRTTQVSLHFEALATKLSMLDGDQKRAFYAIVSNEKWIERILQSRMLHFYLSLMESIFFFYYLFSLCLPCCRATFSLQNYWCGFNALYSPSSSSPQAFSTKDQNGSTQTPEVICALTTSLTIAKNFERNSPDHLQILI